MVGQLLADVEGTGPIDYIEVLHNNRVIERVAPSAADVSDGPVKLGIDVGWSDRGQTVDWDVAVVVTGGCSTSSLVSAATRWSRPTTTTAARTHHR